MLTTKQVQALRESIKHWEDICSVTDIRLVTGKMGPDNCPCCVLWIDKRCRGCPIAKHTGARHCEGSPYDQAWRAVWSGKTNWLRYSKRELSFLRRVLREGMKK